MNHSSSPSSFRKDPGLLAVFAYAVTGFLLFGVFILLIFHGAGDPDTHDSIRALERAKKLETLRTTENKELHEAGWIDEKAGIARIPIDRAMELELPVLRDKPIHEAGPIQPQDINPSLITPPVPATKP